MFEIHELCRIYGALMDKGEVAIALRTLRIIVKRGYKICCDCLGNGTCDNDVCRVCSGIGAIKS